MGRKFWVAVCVCAVCVAAAATARSSAEAGLQVNAGKTEWLPGEQEETIRELARQRERAMQDLSSERVRLESLTKRMDGLKKDLEKEIASDAAIAAIEDARKMKETRLVAIKDLPSFSRDDMDQTIVAIDGFRAALVDRRELIKLRSQGGIYNVISGEIVILTVQIEGDEARLARAEKRMAELRQERK